jgi:hypothetical protein
MTLLQGPLLPGRKLRWPKAAFDRHLTRAAAALPWTGGALMLLAAALALHRWALVRTQQRATATVTEDVAVIAPEGVLYSPRLRFRTPGGAFVQVLAGPGTAEIEFAAGTTVPVLYPPGHPERAVVGTVWHLYAAAIVLAVVGAVVFDIGYVLRIIRRGRPGASPPALG